MDTIKVSELKRRIATYEKAIASPTTTQEYREQMQAKVELLKDALAKAEAEPDPEPEPQPQPEPEPERTSRGKIKVKPENKEKVVAGCGPVLQEIAAIMDRYKTGKPVKQTTPSKPTERKKKRITTKVVEAQSAVVTRAINSVPADKIPKVKTQYLEEAQGHFEKGLRAIKKAFGGTTDSDEWMNPLKETFDSVIKKIKEKKEKETA